MRGRVAFRDLEIPYQIPFATQYVTIWSKSYVRRELIRAKQTPQNNGFRAVVIDEGKGFESQKGAISRPQRPLYSISDLPKVLG